MNDLDAIRRLLALYGQLLDSKRFEDWIELFTQDAVFRFWGRTCRGRDEILREIGGMQPDQPGKHVVLMPVIDLDTNDGVQPDGSALRARAWTDLTALASSDAGISIATIGRYHDRLVKSADDARWRIEERVLVMGGEPLPEDVAPSPAY